MIFRKHLIDGSTIYVNSNDELTVDAGQVGQPDYIIDNYTDLAALFEEMRTTNNHPMGWVHIKGIITPTDTIDVPNCPPERTLRITGGQIVPLTDRTTMEFVPRTWGTAFNNCYNSTIEGITFSGNPSTVGAYPLILMNIGLFNTIKGCRFTGQAVSNNHIFFQCRYFQSIILEDNYYSVGSAQQGTCVFIKLVDTGGGIFNLTSTIKNNQIGTKLFDQASGRAQGLIIENNVFLNLRVNGLNLVNVNITDIADANRRSIRFVNNHATYEDGALPPTNCVTVSNMYTWLVTGNTILCQSATTNPTSIINDTPNGNLKVEANNQLPYV